MRGTLKVDLTRCIACKACETACVVAHSESKTLLGALHEDPRPAPRIRVRYLDNELAAPYQCRHCEDPWCAEACPHGVLGRSGQMLEPVRLDTDACQAAKKCLRACPYDAIRMTGEGTKAYKCDLCIDRLNEGLEPACAEACPTGAILFIEDGPTRPEESVADRQYLVVHEGTSAEYGIDEVACTGCGACARRCPQQCISGERKEAHKIDLSRCIRCGACFLACRFDAVRCTAPMTVLKAACQAAATE